MALGLLIKLYGTKHVPMIRHSHRWHAVFPRFFQEFVETDHPI